MLWDERNGWNGRDERDWMKGMGWDGMGWDGRDLRDGMGWDGMGGMEGI